MTAVSGNTKRLHTYAMLALALWCVTGFASAANLPDGAGKVELTRICSQCHSLEQATSLRQGQAAWTETISKMINLGAQGSPDDFNRILSYLVKFYGSAASAGSANPSPAEGQPANPAAAAASPDVEKASAASANAKEAGLPAGGLVVDAAREWRTYGHDAGAMRFSPLTEMTPENVGRLKVAWVYHMRPTGFKGAPPRRQHNGGAVGDEPPGQSSNPFRFGSRFRPSEDTPLVIHGLMYISTPYARVAAIDPVNGKEIWTYQLPSGNPSTRGLEYWAGDGRTPLKLCSDRVTGSSIRSTQKPGSPIPRLAITA